MPPSQHPITHIGHFYISAVAILGSSVVLHSLYLLFTAPIGYQWFVLAGLTLLSGSFTIRIPTIPARLSVSDTFVFAAAILFGPAAATIIVVLDTLVISFWLNRPARTVSRVAFNVAAPATAIWLASHAFFYAAAIEPLYIAPRPIISLVGPIALLAVLYFLLNSSLIAAAVAFEKGGSAYRVWRANFLWLSLNYFSGASVAALLLPYLQSDESAILRVAGILLPLLLISYLTFKTALGRVEDANRHLTELNKLYLSTIETLAMAIDAKDQITHGHIRRVQHYAVGLARRIGLSDDAQIRAIEAASLLHDMGKLAVPEYILNKPGKLTHAEFEKMKLHASVGADILSAIDFPYPVVPIVRHHHENWDGTGYPDGIRGSAIPIGARILSVVDCFDALTSDRPYRPKLPDADAIRIILERRGTMYDPLVVDTFVRVYRELAPAVSEAAAEDQATLSTIPTESSGYAVKDTGAGAGFENIVASTEEMVVLFDLAMRLNEPLHQGHTAHIVVEHLRRLLPTSTCVFYLYDSATDELVATYVTGAHSDHIEGFRVRRGERLSGWVAANRQTIVNSDPVLDLGETVRGKRPRLYSCLSTPLVHGDSLIGVMTLYSAQRNNFTDDHRRIVEVIARQAASVIATPSNSPSLPVTPSRSRELADAIGPGEGAGSSSSFAFYVALIHFEGGDENRTPEGDRRVVGAIASTMRRATEGPDVLFRYNGTELLALIGHATNSVISEVTGRVAKTIRDMKLSERSGPKASGVAIGFAAAPHDGSDIDALASAARRRARSIESLDGGSPSIH